MEKFDCLVGSVVFHMHCKIVFWNLNDKMLFCDLMMPWSKYFMNHAIRPRCQNIFQMG